MTKTPYAPTGELIDIGGYRLHLHRMGSGSPAVVQAVREVVEAERGK